MINGIKIASIFRFKNAITRVDLRRLSRTKPKIAFTIFVSEIMPLDKKIVT